MSQSYVAVMTCSLYIFYQENTITDNGGEYVQDIEEDDGLRMSSTDNTEVRSEQVRV